MPSVPPDADDEAQPDGLFSEVEGDPPLSTDVETLAGRLVGIDFGQIAEITNPPIDPKDSVTGTPTTPHTLVLNLFEDVVFTGIVEHVEPTASGHALWGSLEGVELGTMTLVVNGKIVVGTVRTPDAVYSIRTAGDGTYVIRQIDESSLPPLDEPLEIPPSSTGVRPKTDDGADLPDDGSVIDVMVVYTPLAKHREGGRAAIEALIDLFVTETNQAYERSGVIHRVRLVLREEVDYFEEVGGNHLGRLAGDSDGYMDHIHDLRDLYAADLVHLVVGRHNYCGTAAGVPSVYALTVNVCGGLTFAHELGHNMGLHHDRYEVGVPLRGANFGYVNQRAFEPDAPESAWWRTIMAYNDQCHEDEVVLGCPGVAYFSNPEKTYKGDPMGVPVDHPSTGVDGPADAVGTLNNRREITANHRRSSSSPTPRVHLTLSPYWLSENGGVSTVTATLHRLSSADTILTVSASPSDAVNLSGNRTLTIPAGQTVSEGVVTLTGVDNRDQTGDVIVTVSATAENPSSLGVIAPESVELAITDDETTPRVSLSLSRAEVMEGGGRDGGRAWVLATLDNRSSAETTVTFSASPAEAIEEIYRNTLTIPAGQTASDGWTWLYPVDDTVFTESRKTVTVSGTATNNLGVTGPESVTLTIIDDDAPIFADDSISYTFTAGVPANRLLLEAEYGNEPLTYSISPAPSNGVTFVPGPPARIGVSETSVASGEASYTLTATDAQGDTDTMMVSITVREGVCPNSDAVSGYSDPGIVADCEALLASRDALRGGQSLNWSEQLSIGDWQGIEILNNRVVRIDMSSKGLSGAIPSELGNLSSLVWLELNHNELTGTIPPELGGLANLRTLSLEYNQLTGEIPSKFGDLVNLGVLYLNGNQLVGPIPADLGNLVNLGRLGLSGNRLTGPIPAELGRLVNLGGLSLNGNQLTGEIPASLGDLVNLGTLNLSNNQLTGALPGWLIRLNNLGVLDLGHNKLTGEIPAGLGNLSNLYWLILRGNNLSGEIPDELGNLTELQHMDLGPNQLTGEIPAWLGDLTKLKGLLIRGTQMTGEIPASLGSLTNLETLYLSDNRLTGEIPTSLSDLSNLDSLDLTGNDLRGEIPAWLGSLTKLKRLRLSENQLSGEIPTELGKLSNLRSLYLSYNRLTGEIPKELGALANLRWLYLTGNELTGCIPAELGDVRNNDLEQLRLPFCDDEIEQTTCSTGSAVPDAANNPGLVSDCEALLASRDTLAGDATLNWSADVPIADWDGITVDGTPERITGLVLKSEGLSGTLPAQLGSLAGLIRLDLGNHYPQQGEDNRLRGTIPPELGSLSNLVQLDLYNNLIEGQIPVELANLGNLEELVLGDNKFTGEIPAELGNLTNLRDLRLWGNELTGTIPPELGNLIILQSLTLNRNELTGAIPTELGNLTKLQSLNLDRNRLTGEIPSELGTLADLQFLWLGENELSGPIPTDLGDLTNIQRLYLASNRLTGEIPSELGRLRNLQVLSLSNNQLTGEIPTELGGFANLRSLWLYDNQLTGEIPEELGTLEKLGTLDLKRNQLTGGIPTVLSSLENLEDLSLTGNQLTGDIPSELGRLANLELLFLGDNQLTGQIPSELGRLARLRLLDLSRNTLIGEIPAELGDLSNLDRLFLAGNQLAGCIPNRLSDVAINDLADLGLPFCESDCETGTAVPDAANNPGLVSDCEALLAARDTLAGDATLNWSVDTTIADWDGITLEGTPQRVTRLRLSRRGLTGEIPPKLGDLTNLERLSLQLNRLSGEIPAELGNLANVQYMQLHYNELTGEVPPDFGGLASLEVLLLDNNQLTGMLPQTMTELTLLRLFYFLDNAGLCAPADDAFQTWLQNVDTFRGSTCGSVDSDEDRPALEALYAATNGQNWEESDNWLSERPISEWHGVTVDVNGRVNGLYLSSNDLAGEIPDDLGSLTGLRRLNLGSNDLTGEIPEELGGLTNLDRLVLSRNGLTGDIPNELENLTNLKWLLIGDNELDGEIPAWLGSFANLQYLYLDRNELTGEIPTELGGLVNLERLFLYDNQLTGSIPTQLGSLVNLEQLRLSENQLTGAIPTELGKLSNLEILYLSDNQLTGAIPIELGNLSNLEDLRLGHNRFSGCLPSELLALEDTIRNDFESLYLVFECAVLLADRDTLAGTATLNWSADTPVAQWDGVKLGETPNRVTRIVLHNEGLNGTVPVSLGRLTRLIDLDLSNNELTGEIPGELGDLYFLRVLNLRTNRLTGPIPDDLGRLRNLKVLNLHSNSLSGGIPDLSGMTSLEELYLPNNADYDVDGDKVEGTGLTGGIPAWLNGMTNMRELWLWGNSLSGSVPDLSGMTSLEKLKLANNGLTGGVPEASTLPPSMTWLIIDRNPFGGTIPDMSALSRLRLLWLHSNMLEGMIPAGDMFPASLDDLNLRDNMLTGTIPDLSGLDTLTRLRLHNNSLSGEVPATLGGLDSLKYLWLHNEDATKSDNGNNRFTSIAAGVGDLADTLIVIALNGNPWNADACVPAVLANVARNDYAEAGISVCSAGDGNGNGN